MLHSMCQNNDLPWDNKGLWNVSSNISIQMFMSSNFISQNKFSGKKCVLGLFMCLCHALSRHNKQIISWKMDKKIKHVHEYRVSALN